MEVNLGIEDILPATVKPDKTLPDSASEEDPFDALGQNLLGNPNFIQNGVYLGLGFFCNFFSFGQNFRSVLIINFNRYQ